MTYSEQTWENAVSSADAIRLSHMEHGIGAAQTVGEEGKTKAETALSSNTSNKALAEEGKTKAEEAKTTATTAKTEAGEGKTKATEAKTKAEEAKTKAEENATKIAEANKVVASEKSANYTLIASDSGKIIEALKSSGGILQITVPKSIFAAGEIVEVVAMGTEKVELVPASGMTLKAPGGSLKTRTQYSGVSIRFRSTTDALVSGDTE